MVKLVILIAALAASVNSQSVTVEPTTTAATTTVPSASSDELVYLVGGLFEPQTEHIENAFMDAFDKTNTKRTLGTLRMKGKVAELELADSFQASESVCELLKDGVLALYGPQSPESTAHVQSMASWMEIPHLEARVDFKPPGNHSVNLMPSPYVMARAFRDLVTKLKFQSFAIVYGSEDSLLRMQEFLTDENIRSKPMTVSRTTGENNKQILNRIRGKGIRNILLDVSVRDPKFAKFMKDAQAEGMLSEYYTYVTTSLDLEQAEVPIVDASILSFSLIATPGTTYSAASALTYDAVQLFAESLAELLKTKPLVRHNRRCGLDQSWQYGQEIRKQLLKTKIDGMTGEVKFDEAGIRSDIKLRLLENLGDAGNMKTIGSWTPTEGIRINENHALEKRQKYQKILTESKNLLVVKTNTGKPTEGFVMDLLDALQAELGFKKKTVEQVQGYGVTTPSGQWTGMMARVVNVTADIALADLTITQTREEAADFTIPFLSTGIAVLIKKSDVGNMTEIEDLLNQNAVTYGTLASGSTAAFLAYSNDSRHNEMRRKMEDSCPRWWTRTIAEGVDKVKAGGYALFAESVVVEYIVNNDCDLTRLGGMLDPRGYGIALPKGSPYTSLFSEAILKLKEAGKVQELKAKHWNRNPPLDCNNKP